VTAHRSVVITGASDGIGAALACTLAGPGRRLLLVARRADRLDAVAQQCREAGAATELAALDVTHRQAMADTLMRYDAASPVDLVIANAGVSAGLRPGQAPEEPTAARRVFDVHIHGMLNTLDPLLPSMLARGEGQIALMSSLAAMAPLADMPSYSASKAAIRAYGTSLRRWLRPRGVAVSVICPGFVTSPMSARHKGFKPFEIPSDRAATRILRGLARREAYITFPWQLALLTWLGERLPPPLADRVMRGFAADIVPDRDLLR
jgi:short-subunit dehydrogenase